MTSFFLIESIKNFSLHFFEVFEISIVCKTLKKVNNRMTNEYISQILGEKDTPR